MPSSRGSSAASSEPYSATTLAWCNQYATADHDSVLWQSAMIKKPAGWFEYDALNDRLPQVSWLVAPSAQCEHPDWTAAAGAQYIASKIDAIAANPKVWAKTAFILMYDENDGYFDHVLPPTAPAGTADEYVDGAPIGLGFRVPCTIVSPWTVGGYVATETFDHTSLIRFLEQAQAEGRAWLRAIAARSRTATGPPSGAPSRSGGAPRPSGNGSRPDTSSS